MLVIFIGIAISSSAQRAVDAPDAQLRSAHIAMSPSSSEDSSQGEYADLKLSNSVRQLAHWTGLPPKTIFHFFPDAGINPLERWAIAVRGLAGTL